MNLDAVASLLDTARVDTTLRTRLPFRAELAGVTALAGDASNRRYYRLALRNGPVASIIVMQLAGPETWKASEEAVSGEGGEIHELPFLNILRPLARAGVTVPAVYWHDDAAGLLYLEDFGDLTLWRACAEGGPAAVRRYYPPAVDTLVQMQLRLTPSRAGACQAFSRSFDMPLLMWEFDHFLEYGIAARRGLPMRAEDERDIREACAGIAAVMAGQPRVFTHRDYHSRNLMIAGGRIGVIDFQDALQGPAAYDLASLLRDAYVALDDAMVDVLISRYLEAMRGALEPEAQARMLLTDGAAFRRVFDFTSIQRNLKAVGRFVYLDRVKGRAGFLADIPRTLGSVRRTLARYPELDTLLRRLTPYIPEWQSAAP